ncbi:MAG TPA: DapH/DapD/GlmU-related protein [Solirubrobacteraceae bacterium]
MSLRAGGRAARAGARRARFAAWAGRLRVELARNGGRLVLDAPHGARFDEPPLIKASHHGGSGGTLTLRLGRDVDLGRHTVLQVWAGGDSALELGDGTTLGQGSRLVLRNGAIRLGRSVQVRDVVVLKSDGELSAGDWVIFGHAAVVAATGQVVLGDRVGLGERVSVIDSDHGADGSDAFYLRQPLRVAPVRVASNVLVGANAVILRGTEIGPNAVVAAGAVVAGGEHPAGWLIGGVPARALKALGGTLAR